jgi:hypothetical protein
MATEYKLEDIMGGAANKAVPSAENVIQQTQESMPAKTDFEIVEISPEDRKEIDRIRESCNISLSHITKLNHSIRISYIKRILNAVYLLSIFW